MNKELADYWKKRYETQYRLRESTEKMLFEAWAAIDKFRGLLKEHNIKLPTRKNETPNLQVVKSE